MNGQLRDRQHAAAEGRRLVVYAERCAAPQSALPPQVSVPAWVPRLSGAIDRTARDGRRLNTSIDRLVGKKGFQQLGQRLVSAG